jgi:hypothetical protein
MNGKRKPTKESKRLEGYAEGVIFPEELFITL